MATVPLSPAEPGPGLSRPAGPGAAWRRLAGLPLAWWRTLTPTGRAVLNLGGICAVLGSWTSLVELRLVGGMGLALVALAVPWLLLPVRVTGRMSMHPPRAVAGDSIRVQVSLGHGGGLALRHPLVRLPVGSRTSWLRWSTLSRGASASEAVTVDTVRRGVIDVGPPHLVRTDPLGLLRSERPLGPARELYVRPVMVALDSLGIGHVRDAEGTASDRMSMSDLAFHALREYVPGDDLRHVHWRSSARAGELLVRQYHDSRRNQTTVVLDTGVTSYGVGTGGAGRSGAGEGGEQAFELAASVAASLVVCAAGEDHVVSLLAGTERLFRRSTQELLDGLCRVEQGDHQIIEDVATAVAETPETGVLLVVTGDGAPVEQVAGALWVAPADTRTVLLRVSPGAAPALSLHHGREVLTLGSLADLPGLMGASR